MASRVPENFDYSAAVGQVLGDITEAKNCEFAKTASYGQLARRLYGYSGTRAKNASLLFKIPFQEVLSALSALGRFFSCHAFWSSKDSSFTERLSHWGKDLYEGAVESPLLLVIQKIAGFVGIIEPRLVPSVQSLIPIVKLISRRKLEDRITCFAHPTLKKAVDTLVERKGSGIVDRIFSTKAEHCRNGLAETADAIAQEIFGSGSEV